MPHSGGGGSHGGGYHSGGSYHSSRSSGGSSYSSAPPPPPVCRRPYAGASTYIYYDRRGRYHTYYLKGSPRKASISDAIAIIVTMGIILIPIILLLSFCIVDTPTKVTTNYDTNITIYDSVGVVDQKEVYECFEDFQDLTGITMSLQVIYDSQRSDYTSLDSYSYAAYVTQFTDEKHWLLVVSYPDDYQTTKFVNWSWQNMIGDDIYTAVDSSDEERFTKIFHDALLRSEPSELTQAITGAFSEFSVGLMDSTFSVGFLIAAIVFALLYAWIVFACIRSYRDEKNMESAISVKQNFRECICDYCGYKYVYGTITACKHCGAPVPVLNVK